MPELPEVETVKNTLKSKLQNRTIKKVTVYHDNIIEYPDASLFCKQLINQQILDMNRYGKWLIFVLDDYYLLSHLRMEGKYFFKQPEEELNKHEHVVFLLDDNTELRYMDVRKFGKMHLIKKEEIEKKGPFLKMGLEPWDDKLTINYLKEKYQKKKLPIKTVLLDQSIIVGIGNIYANEILFLSGISPLQSANSLTDASLIKITQHTRQVLEKAIQQGGTTIRTYTSVDGVHGLFQQQLNVHGREGETCPTCQNIILKIKVGGRGTYYCPTCQK